MLASTRESRILRLLLANENRRRIFEAIRAEPGIHVRLLSRQLQLALGSVEHHLRQLDKHGLVVSYKTGRRRGYFAAADVQTEDVPVLHALSKPQQARILLHLAQCKEARPCDIAAAVGLTTPQASYHLRRMRHTELVDHVSIGRQSLYFLPDPERVHRWTHPGWADLVSRARALEDVVQHEPHSLIH